ncbi:uracil-DNA glycosylase Ung2 [Scenedesmus sp. NREL 46B-D3]|nr:uracil-DNA glycosylase Ung2 [Scenedesmus sp. NREL 46B-D3]
MLGLVEGLATNWRHHLRQLLAPHACTLDMYLEAERQMCEGIACILPRRQELVFNAFAHSELDDTCVVILGEPYAVQGWAHGLAYSVPAAAAASASSDSQPAALHAILSELAAEYGTLRTSTDLTDWARQGVLLLNTSLTSRESCCSQASHHAAWEPFVDNVLRYISGCVPSVVFMLWGKAARAKAHLIDGDGGQHLVLQAPHPVRAHEFAGCNHFAMANNWLVSRARRPVRWV